MNWYKRNKFARYMPIDPENDMGEFEEQTGMDVYDAQEQGEQAFNVNKLYVSRDKNLSQVVLPDEENKVVGGLASGWTEVTGEADKPIWEYSFDLSVLPAWQKQGIGRQLIDNAIKQYETDKSNYTEQGDVYTRMKVWAINPIIMRILEEEKGFNCEVVARENGKDIQWFCYRY